METITLQDGLQYLVNDRRIVAGAAVAWGNGERADSLALGSAREVLKSNGTFVPAAVPLTRDSVFDLASVTKLFTCLSVLLLRQEGKLNLEDPVGRFDRRFTGISDVPVGDLLSFLQPLGTRRRIDEMDDRHEAERELFQLQKTPQIPGRYYTDMGSMALKYVIEGASGRGFYDYLKERVLLPLDMTDTWSRVPEEVLSRTVCYNYERRINGGVYTVDEGCPTGTVNDKKARVLSDGGRDLCGHAGLFSTVGDLSKLARGLIWDALFPHAVLTEMGTARTGKGEPVNGNTQYLGYLCYAKHPIQTYSEVPACFGYRTVALNGYTGNHFSVDPERNQFIVILANKTHNRITSYKGRPDPFDATEALPWPDGHAYPVSQNYTYLKDRYIKEPVAALLDGGAAE